MKFEDIESFAETMDTLVKKNTPLYSKIKHLAIDLGDCYEKMSSLLFRISNHVAQIISNREKTH